MDVSFNRFYTVTRKFMYLKNKGIPSGTSSQTLDIRHGTSFVARRCQPIWTTVDAQCDKMNCRRSNSNCAHTRLHKRLTALFPGLSRSAGTRKVKPIWILLKQETVSGSGISWAICKSVHRSRQITTPAPHHSSFFTGWMPFLPPNQQRQSTEG